MASKSRKINKERFSLLGLDYLSCPLVFIDKRKSILKMLF